MKFLPATMLALSLLTSAVVADDADRIIRERFGTRISQAVGTADTADDAALAADLYKAAAAETGNPAVAIALCDKAWTMGSLDPVGYDAACQAMNHIAVLSPEREAEARQNVVDLRQKQYNAARGSDKRDCAEALINANVAMGEMQEQSNDYLHALLSYRRAGAVALAVQSPRVKIIQAGINAAANRQRKYNDLTKLIERYEKDPDNRSLATQLARVYLYEMDDPQTAAKFADKCDDPTIAQNAKLAQMPVKTLSLEQSMQLGEWYSGIAMLSDPAMRGALHLRAHRYYTAAFDKADANDKVKRQIVGSLDIINLSLREVGIEPPATPQLAVAAPPKPVETQPTKPAEPAIAERPNRPSRPVTAAAPEPPPAKSTRGRPTFFGVPTD
ncbi:MAG: hypothetical protein GC162_05565 [Planctomycetes bacterium]|nr:hypothetical protein [Planctomycetota bacterium]